MFRVISSAVILGCLLTGGTAVCSDIPQSYSRKELKALMHSAHTAEQYQRLSLYFQREAVRFTDLANGQERSMRQELEQSTHAKYPSGYETALRLRDYYRQCASQAGQKAASYDRLIHSQDSKTASR